MFKLIHISDLHFAAGPNKGGFIAAFASNATNERNGRHNQDLADLSAYFIAKNLGDYDCLLISGDIATRGTEADLQVARQYVLAPATQSGGYLSTHNRPTLSYGSRPTVLLPGNHDRFKGPLGEPGSDKFEHAFPNHWKVGLNGVQSVKVVAASGVEVSIISADFTLISKTSASVPGGHFSQGRCIAAILSYLKWVTNTIRKRYPERGIIWVSHFPPPVDSFDIGVYHELIDGDLLLTAARSCSVEYILCGHLHKQGISTYNGVTVIMAGTLCQWPSKNGNWIHALEFVGTGQNLKLSAMNNFLYNSDNVDFGLDVASSF
ncbi:metallophosphoesterase [Methylobacterium sp. WL9]|uniref:metallophosphoesterase family protein n=1 Tax=Methylobacterium sp. WL9 TaxID=2603898 RepID=UPI00164F6DFC|nr:metallophosphoesterase [Methylobacterium sp. WL9]